MIRRYSEHGLLALLPALRRTWQRLRTWERRQAGLDGSLSSPRLPSSQGSDPASYPAEPPASFRTNRQSIEIARKDGVEFRSVRLRLEDDGRIKVDAQDIGPTVTEFRGHDDYEFWVRVPPASVSKLALELLREKFSGQLGAVDAFWCKAHGVEHKFEAWP
jgi:hypothetical protein